MYNPVRSHFFWPLLSHSLLAATILLLGNVESLISSSGVALAQTVPNQQAITRQQVSDYAAAVLEIEPIRLRYYNLARQQTDGKMPPNLCMDNENTSMANKLASICQSYMAEAKSVIIKHDLTQDQFNTITTQAQNDQALSDRIQKELRQQQKVNSKAKAKAKP